jgi:hypothetical protein
LRKLEKLLEQPINALFWLAALVTIIMMLLLTAVLTLVKNSIHNNYY